MQRKITSNFEYGFTLAEILITLVIIGVIAAFTIPTLINNTKKQEYVAGLKKANSVLSQALYKMTENNAYPVGDYSYLNESNFIDEFAKVVSTVKKCDTFAECFDKGQFGYKALGNYTVSISLGKSVITSDGQMYSFVAPQNIYGISQEDADNTTGRIIVDINGGKNPNQLGYDLFLFYLVKNKGIIPAGSNSTAECDNSSGSAAGWTCAARVLKENAMNY